MSITGLSPSQMASYRLEAQRLISNYDRNGDGAISQDEVGQQISLGADSFSFTNRVSNGWVERTTVFEERFATLNPGTVAGASGGDRASADDLVNAYLTRKDSNHNGNLSFWEKLTMSLGGMRDMFQSTTTVETGRSTSLEFDPVFNPPTPFRPSPPSVDPFSPGPRPPSPTPRPTPPDPFSPGPRPPAPTPRPTPPGGDRPTPPSVTPSRPTPPSSGPSNRPTPPRVH